MPITLILITYLGLWKKFSSPFRKHNNTTNNDTTNPTNDEVNRSPKESKDKSRSPTLMRDKNLHNDESDGGSSHRSNNLVHSSVFENDDADKAKIKELPPAALKVYKSSGLTDKQVLLHWSVFINCLYYSTPRKTFARPPPPVPMTSRRSNDNMSATTNSEYTTSAYFDTSMTSSTNQTLSEFGNVTFSNLTHSSINIMTSSTFLTQSSLNSASTLSSLNLNLMQRMKDLEIGNAISNYGSSNNLIHSQNDENVAPGLTLMPVIHGSANKGKSKHARFSSSSYCEDTAIGIFTSILQDAENSMSQVSKIPNTMMPLEDLAPSEDEGEDEDVDDGDEGNVRGNSMNIRSNNRGGNNGGEGQEVVTGTEVTPVRKVSKKEKRFSSSTLDRDFNPYLVSLGTDVLSQGLELQITADPSLKGKTSGSVTPITLETVSYQPTIPKRRRRKHFTKEELDRLVEVANPKEIYTAFREIGKGSYGKVYIATKKDEKKKYALKQMKRDWEEDPDGIANEITVLDTCHHPNIVNYITSYLWNRKVWMVMEYCDAGTLKQLLVIEMSEVQIANVIQQVLSGISYLHKSKRIHRDIKSSNILLNMNGDVKVADLGLCIEGEGEMSGMAGSKYWMAPEMIKRHPYNAKVDIWSIGALCIEMAEGNPPYSQYKPLKALFLTATRGAPSLRKPDKWTPTFKDFLNQCFQTDPTQRPTAESLLEHDFVKKACDKKELVKALKLVFLMRVTAGL